MLSDCIHILLLGFLYKVVARTKDVDVNHTECSEVLEFCRHRQFGFSSVVRWGPLMVI